MSFNLGAMAFSTHSSALPSNLVRHTFSRGDLIPLQPSLLLRIEQGAVRTLTWSEQGTTVTLGYWGAGDVVGQPLSRIEPYQIECLTNTEASYIPVQHSCQVLDALFRHMQQAEEILCIVRQERIHHRLQLLLNWLAQKFGRVVEQGQLIDLRLTHQDMAQVIGTTRVTVTRLLAKFEEEGIIYRPYRHFIVLRGSL